MLITNLTVKCLNYFLLNIWFHLGNITLLKLNMLKFVSCCHKNEVSNVHQGCRLFDQK